MGILEGRIVSSDKFRSSDGTIHIGCEGQQLYSSTSTTLDFPETFTVRGAIPEPPAIGANGTLFCGTVEGRFYAYDPKQNKLRWQTNYASNCSFAPSIGADGIGYMVMANALCALELDPLNGQTKWKTLSTDDVTTPLVSADGTFFVGCQDERLYGVQKVVRSNRTAPTNSPSYFQTVYTPAQRLVSILRKLA